MKSLEWRFTLVQKWAWQPEHDIPSCSSLPHHLKEQEQQTGSGAPAGPSLAPVSPLHPLLAGSTHREGEGGVERHLALLTNMQEHILTGGALERALASQEVSQQLPAARCTTAARLGRLQ